MGEAGARGRKEEMVCFVDCPGRGGARVARGPH